AIREDATHPATRRAGSAGRRRVISFARMSPAYGGLFLEVCSVGKDLDSKVDVSSHAPVGAAFCLGVALGRRTGSGANRRSQRRSFKRRGCVYEVSYAGRTYQQGKKIGWRDGCRALWMPRLSGRTECELGHGAVHSAREDALVRVHGGPVGGVRDTSG